MLTEMNLADGISPAFYACSFAEVHGDSNQYFIQYSQPAFHILRNAISSGAAFDAEDRFPPARCHPQTRLDTRAAIRRWISYRKSSIMWLHGPAGAGKSAVAQTICEECAERGELLASFFFSRGTVSRRDIRRFIPTLAYQIAHVFPKFKQAVLRVLDNNLAVLDKESSKQLEELIIQPLRFHFQNAPRTRSPFLVIVDGLDECEGQAHQQRILQHLHTLSTMFPLRFLVVSRPEHHIRHIFETALKGNSDTESLCGDIKDVYTYLKGAFTEIGSSDKHSDILFHVATPWPGDEVLQILTKRSEGYFIYASTIVKYVDEEGFVCLDRLETVLHPDATRKPESSPFRELDKLYMQVLAACPNLPLLKLILGCLILEKTLFWGLWGLPLPLEIDHQKGWTTQVITLLLDLRPGQVRLTLRGLSSVVRLSEENVHDIKFYHSSFQDFLIDKARSGPYFVDTEHVADVIFRGSLRLLKQPRKYVTPDLGVWIAAIFAWFSAKRPAERLVETLRSFEIPMCFMPVITESQSWTASEQYYLLASFATMIASIEDHESPACADLLSTLTSICTTAFQMYLGGGNSMEEATRLAFFIALPKGRKAMDMLELDLLLSISVLSEEEKAAIHRSRELARFIDNSDEDSDDWDYSAKAIGCTIQTLRNLLKRFVNSYLCDPTFLERRDSYFASLWLKFLTAENWSSLSYPQRAIVLRSWTFCLSASPSDVDLLSALRQVDTSIKEVTVLRHSTRVLSWLKKFLEPPADMVTLWESVAKV